MTNDEQEQDDSKFFDATAPAVFQYLILILRDRRDAEDVLQETFLRFFQTRKPIRNRKAFLFQIARNEAFRWFRRERFWRLRRSFVGNDLFEPSDDSSSPERSLEEAEENRRNADRIAAAIGKLSTFQRELVSLKIYSNLTFEEIAAVVDRPFGTVASGYRRTLQKLRTLLNDY